MADVILEIANQKSRSLLYNTLMKMYIVGNEINLILLPY